MYLDDHDSPTLRRFQRKVLALSAGSTFLDGYDLTVIAVALTTLTKSWSLSSAEKSLVTSAALVGAFIGALVLGNLTDRFGRKAMFVVDLMCFVVFAVASGFSTNLWMLVALRFLLGIGIGADYSISATLVAEFSSSRVRGRLGTTLGAFWFVGALAAYLCALALHPLGDNAWRYLLILGGVFAAILFAFRVTLPESPAWLASHGRHEEASAVISQVVGRHVEYAPTASARVGIGALFTARWVKRTFFVCGFWFCYSTAYYGISMYVPIILSHFHTKSPVGSLLGSTVVAAIGLVGAIIGICLVDVVGRRPLLIASFTGLSIALAMLAVNSNPSLVFLVILFSCAVLFSNAGGGILNFVYPTELFPTSIRATAAGLATAVSRIGSILGVVAFPNMITAWGMSPALWIFCGVALTGLAITLVLAPETKNRPLAAVSADDAAPLPVEVRA